MKLNKFCSCFLAMAAFALAFTLGSCEKETESPEVISQYDFDRGLLTGINWHESYTPSEFEKKYSSIIGGIELSRMSEMIPLLDIESMLGNATRLLLSRQERELQNIFNREQGTGIRNARWEMQVFSIKFKSIGYKDEPIELSAIIAFPNAVNASQFHKLDGISIVNHARIDTDDIMPSKRGDIMLLRAFYNQLVVIPDEEGGGASLEHYFAETENDRNSQQTIDAVKAAFDVMASMGVEMNEGYGTQNFGISLGGETCIGFHHYMDVNATPEEKRLINLKATFGGAGVITPSMYFKRFDNGTAETSLDMGLALNQLEGILELPASKLGGYDPRTEIFSKNLFKRPSDANRRVTLMEARRLLTSMEYPNEDFQAMFCEDMLTDDGRFNYESPKTKALFDYLKTCDLGYGWTPESKLTLVWSDEDLLMQPFMHLRAYEELRTLPQGGTNQNMRKYVFDLSFMPDIMIGMSHHILCAHYFLRCIENLNPEELGTY